MRIDPPPGQPVGFSLLTSGLAGLPIWAGVDPAFGILTFESIYRTPTNFMLLVIPLFILMARLGLEQMTLRGYRKWLAAGSIAGSGVWNPPRRETADADPPGRVCHATYET